MAHSDSKRVSDKEVVMCLHNLSHNVCKDTDHDICSGASAATLLMLALDAGFGELLP